MASVALVAVPCHFGRERGAPAACGGGTGAAGSPCPERALLVVLLFSIARRRGFNVQVLG